MPRARGRCVCVVCFRFSVLRVSDLRSQISESMRDSVSAQCHSVSGDDGGPRSAAPVARERGERAVVHGARPRGIKCAVAVGYRERHTHISKRV